MKKRFFACLTAILLLFTCSAWAENSGDTPAWQAYNGKRIGVLTGPLMEDIAHNCFPDSEYLLFNSYPDCIAALLAGRIDAYLVDEPEIKSVQTEQPKIDYIHERITSQEYSFAFRKNDEKSAALCEEMNGFLAQCRADGTLQELEEIWFGSDEARKVVDMSDLTGENGTIRVVTTSTDMPFSYIKDEKNVGYDIDLVVRFCRYAGYDLELGDVDFAARIPAIQSGKYDFTTDMNVTEERKEQVLFSDPTSTGGVVLAILKAEAQTVEAPVQPGAYRTLTDLAKARVGIPSGTSFDAIVAAALPEARLSYYNSQNDLLLALSTSKIDAFPSDEPVIRYIMSQRGDITYIPEYLDSFEFAYCFARTGEGERLQKEFSDFIRSLKADGSLDELTQKWFGADETAKTMPDYRSFPATNGVLRMATDGDYPPFEYVRDGSVVGYDVDIAAQFCQEYGYGLEIEVMNLDAVLPAVQSGKCSFGGSAITITPEREESVLFSESNYTGGTVLTVRKAEPAKPAAEASGTYTTLEELNGKRIGVQTGTSFDMAVTERLPNAEVSYFNSKPDMINALLTYKIDAYAVDEPVARSQMQQNDRLTYVPEYMESFNFAYVFPKTEAGRALCDQFSEFLRTLRDNGGTGEIEEKWFSEDETVKTLDDYRAFPAENGVLHMATEAMYEPFSYIKDNQIVGYDIDIVVRFCKAYGYGLEITDMSFDAVLPSVQSGKCDFGGAGITITEERKESVLFSEPNYSGGSVLTVLKADVQSAARSEDIQGSAQAESFWDGIASSFNKTFLRENRWKLFLEGVGNTMLITTLSILFGTALGFLVFMACRNGNVVANGISRFSMWLVQGTPMVVLLMILYYIIFGSVAISGIAVAVIGFTLTFGAAVFGMLKMGVGSIDRGQYEAAYALGHSNRHTFFKIILPQAIPLVLPAYQGEIVSLIKATAIVGYIAVQDLTKMGDIVRSRTYEAFFPLIAITVIYFVLEGLFSFAVSRIRVSIDPRKRRRERILKGVNTHDQN